VNKGVFIETLEMFRQIKGNIFIVVHKLTDFCACKDRGGWKG
jgi:hypothetical protein